MRIIGTIKKTDIDLSLRVLLTRFGNCCGTEQITILPCSCGSRTEGPMKAIHIEVKGKEHRAKVTGALFYAGARRLGFADDFIHVDTEILKKTAYIIGQKGDGDSDGDRLFSNGMERYGMILNHYGRFGFKRVKSLVVAIDYLEINGSRLRPCRPSPNEPEMKYRARRMAAKAERETFLMRFAEENGLTMDQARALAEGVQAK